MRIPMVVAAAITIAGCASKPPAQTVLPKFDPAAHRAYLVTGNGEIRGQAFLRQPDDSVTCAGGAVIATPATPFFRELLGLAARGQMPLIGEAVGPDYVSIVHASVCDTAGNFSIAGLPPGDWLVAATVNWTVRNTTNGGLLVYKVRLRNPETVQIVMTDRDVGIPH